MRALHWLRADLAAKDRVVFDSGELGTGAGGAFRVFLAGPADLEPHPKELMPRNHV